MYGQHAANLDTVCNCKVYYFQMAVDIYARVVGQMLEYELKIADSETVNNIGVLAWHGMHQVAEVLESRSGKLKLKLLYTLACDSVNFKDMDAQAIVLANCTWYGAKWYRHVPEDVDKLITDLIIYTRHQHRPVFVRNLTGDYQEQFVAIMKMPELDYPPEAMPAASPSTDAGDSPVYVMPNTPPASPGLAYQHDVNQWQPSLSPLSDSWANGPDSPPASPSLLAVLSGDFPAGNPATDPLRS